MGPVPVDPRPRTLYRHLTMEARTAEASSHPRSGLGPDLRPVEGPLADTELSVLCRALGHPARVRIIRLLSQQNRCINGQIVQDLELAQSTVSQHLKVLKDAGLVRCEAEGTRARYCLEPSTLRRFRSLSGAL